MAYIIKKIVFLTLLCVTLTRYGLCQSSNHSIYEHLITAQTIKEHVLALCSPQMEGRAMGSRGGELAGQYIEQAFKEYNIEKRGINYTQPFTYNGKEGKNIIGEVSSTGSGEDYIIICAHYDHIGKINSKIYPGADDNASGVAALLQLARLFSTMKQEGKGVKSNLIFIAFDGKEANMAGSRHFVSTTKIHPRRVKCVINIDQIGSTLSPPGENREYLLVLGADALKPWMREQLDLCNRLSGINIDIDYSYYGSKKFYDIFYRLSDHYSFTELAIPALLFTCGIDSNTYKVTDTPDTIDYEVVKKKIRLIYRFIYNLSN